ncbi:MAG: hypothetical protein HKN23_00640 [Verrucomicrobiales bacterium]|nr:hypothetical protein [Verrucomicrobiales bacterium]
MWRKTIWDWHNGPSNQVLFSILSRIAHGPADLSPNDPESFYFSEWKVRLPSFFAGVGAIFATGWLVWLLGAPRGAPIAGFFLALHPMFIRYGTEARGYALMMFLAPLAICFLIRALQSGRLRWWIPFGATQFLLLTAYFGSVYFLVPLNLVAIWLAWDFPKTRNPLRSGQLWRYTGSTLFGAMLTIQFFLPNLLQLPAYLEGGRLNQPIDYSVWAQDTAVLWPTGTPLHEWEPENPNSLTISELAPAPALAWLIVATFWGGVILGLVLLLRRAWWRWFSIVLIGPVLWMFLQACGSGLVLYPWYSVGFLTTGVALFALPWGRLLRSGRRIPAASAILALAVIVPLVSHQNLKLICKNSVEPLAESTREIRRVVNPFHPEIDEVWTISFHHYSRLYDPAGIVAKTDDEFLAILQEAEATGKPVAINTAHLDWGRTHFPGTFALLDDRTKFEEPVVFPGLQQPCTRFVYRRLR